MVLLYPDSLKLSPLLADMLSYCYFCSDKHQCLAPGIYPVLFRFPQGLLNPAVSFPEFFRSFFIHTASSSNSSSHHRGREHLLLPWAFFSVAFLFKYLTGCVSHCCIVGGNHGVYVCVIISHVDEWCKFPTYCCLECACYIRVSSLLTTKPQS